MSRILPVIAFGGLMIVWGSSGALAGDEKSGLSFSGDLRGRYEIFDYSKDATGSEKDTRGRIRYRIRIDGEAVLSSRAGFHLRIGTGLNDSRSGNVTLGDPIDFGSNSFGVRRVYMAFSPWENGSLPGDRGRLVFHFGRVPNPLVWKNGQDKMIWDNDIALAGASGKLDIRLAGPVSLILSGGYFAIDETSSGNDPYLGAVQAGLVAGGERVTAGLRGTYHHFAELDSLFVQRGVDGTGGATSSGGNVPDGLTGGVHGGRMRIVESQAFVTAMAGDVPVTFFGGFSANLDAAGSKQHPGVSEEERAYNAGAEGGDPNRSVRLGFAWLHVEANAFPSQFIDSDFLDGRTNREGLLVFLKRRVMEDIDAGVQAFRSDAIETGDGLENSVKDSKRFRLQIDAIYHF